jgi:hypothetical protein
MTDDEYLQWLYEQCQPELLDVSPSDEDLEERIREAIRNGSLRPEDADEARRAVKETYSTSNALSLRGWLIDGLREHTLIFVRNHPAYARLERLSVGVLPTHRLNGTSIRTPAGASVVALDSGVLHAIGLLTFCYWSFYTWPRPDYFCKAYPRDDLVRTIIALAAYCVWQDKKTWAKMPVQDLLVKTRDPTMLSQFQICCRQFILLHEYGHFALGHLGAAGPTRKLSIRGGKAVEVDEDPVDQRMEFEADAFALDHVVRGQKEGHTFPVLHFSYAMGLVLRFFDLCEAVQAHAREPRASTHPPAISRWIRLRTGLNAALGRMDAPQPIDLTFDSFLYESGLTSPTTRDPAYESLYNPGRPPILL